MKMILLAASVLALGGVAHAQDAMQPAPATPAQSGSSAGAPGTATTPPADPAMSAPAMSAPATPSADTAAPATPPADASGTAASTDDSTLPKCSKTVTDKCKQGSGHGKMHHKKK